MSLTIEEIHVQDSLREAYLHKVYDKILNECCEYIRVVHQRLHRRDTIYEVPYGFPGEEEYDFLACLVHILEKLRSAGFYVRYVHPNMIYISWLNKEREQKRMNDLKRLMLEDILTKRTIQKSSKQIKYHKEKQKMLEYH